MTKSGKHCGKRRNCSFWAIFSFVTMFSKSCLLQRHQKASIWGKGLNTFDLLLAISSLSAFLDLYNKVSRPARKPTLWTLRKVLTRIRFSVSGITTLYIYLPKTECVGRISLRRLIWSIHNADAIMLVFSQDGTNPFSHVTNIQQTSVETFWQYGKLYKLKYYCWLRLKTLWQKEKLSAPDVTQRMGLHF